MAARSLSSTVAPEEEYDDDWYEWLPSMFVRLLSAFGMAHVVTEYGADLTLCSGPSMLPTLFPQGEIILVDRLTPRLYGIQGGCVGRERVKLARQRQEEFEDSNPQHDYTWHQVMISANRHPANGKWNRFWSRVTTGISVGDVVVVQHPQRYGTVCKRVLGLPGDVVVRPPPQRQRPRSRARAPKQPEHLIVVPDGHVWLEGDNSMNSSDSRTYGAVPAALIVGHVVCRVWPIRGDALIERGWRPKLPHGRICSGSTILPAGYEGEEIIWFDDTTNAGNKKVNERNRSAKASG
jgi:signal peptidase I